MQYKKHIEEYFNQKRDLLDHLLDYIENPMGETDEINFNILKDIIDNYKIQSNREELENFLLLLLNISNNHHRTPNFMSKITKIIKYLSNEIQQNFTNEEIFAFFHSSKPILLFLLNEKILLSDESIMKKIDEKDKFLYLSKEPRFCHFFLPELKKEFEKEKYLKIESEININDFENYEKNRQIGENESYICSLIRNDSVIEFISYLTRMNIRKTKLIEPSIFETNIFLIDKKPTLIEYAAFFGAIQIFQYLKINNAELKPSILLYAVHSNNAELIHLIEDFFAQNKGDLINVEIIENCFKEAIKCHHIDIANYFNENYLLQKNDDQIENFISCSFEFCNYAFFPNNFTTNDAFFYLCKYNYLKIVDIFLKSKKKEIKSIKI